ncbi:MAG: glycerate kinase, partial [Acidimicrobiales bacterium]
DLVASVAGLEAALGPASVDTDGTSPADCGLEAVATGEGLLDATSLEGKVVGGVATAARRRKVPVLAIVGGCALDVASDPLGAGNEVVSLSAAYGTDRAWSEPERLIADVTAAWLARLRAGSHRHIAPTACGHDYRS